MIREALLEAVERRGEASLALAGGRTPEPVYRRLAEQSLPWDRVSLFFSDERAVPPDDERSNFRMVRLALLDRLPIVPRAVHRMEAERDDPEGAADDYAALLPDRLDLLLLGIGEDGHTASLFFGSPALDERRRRVVPAAAPSPPRRLTITPPVIAAARQTLVIATSARKAAPVQRALAPRGSTLDCPARLAREGSWLLDREAARDLRRDQA
jgi:6-phosphogluconolactonase